MGMLWIASDLTDADVADLRDRLRGTNRSLEGALDTLFGYTPGTTDVAGEVRERLKVASVGGIEQCEDCDYWEDVEDVEDGVCDDCLDADDDDPDDDDEDEFLDEDEDEFDFDDDLNDDDDAATVDYP